MKLLFHPLADLFPLLQGRDFTDLVEDNRIRAEKKQAGQAERAARVEEAAALVPAASERYRLVHGSVLRLLDEKADERASAETLSPRRRGTEHGTTVRA